MIDLHLHSVYSDGSDTPEAIVRSSVLAGMKAIALTDHDTAAGIDDFFLRCAGEPLTGIAGIEFSAKSDGGPLHILGLGIDASSAQISALVEETRMSRNERNLAIIDNLGAIGINIPWEEVLSYAHGGIAGRPHIAMAMQKHGFAGSVQEAFDLYLGKGSKAYVPRESPLPSKIMHAIAASGGIAVLAHPFTWHADADDLERGIKSLAADGLAAIECYHSSHAPDDTVELMRLAHRLGLLVTGGTDYHGEKIKPDVKIGRGRGNMAVPAALLEPILGRIGPKGFVCGKEAER